MSLPSTLVSCRTWLSTAKFSKRRSRSERRSMSSTQPMLKAITMETINPNVVKLEYAVRGPLVARAAEIEQELKKGASKPFKKVIRANLGDAHAMGQKPVTFIRQVLACVSDPSLIKKSVYPEDVTKRASELLAGCGGGSAGAYTSSYGIEVICRGVAEFIEQRDGFPARWQDVVLTSGASTGIKYILELMISKDGGKPAGVMVPIPQYPLYSATLALYGLAQIGYFLDEDKQWALEIQELERALEEASSKCTVRAIVVINPGNPTGQVLSRENVEKVIKFAHKHNLLIFADEVYQYNIYIGKFFSFKKIMMELGGDISKSVEVASFNSISKGYAGECGLRGGWMELVNFDPEVQANLYKAISSNLCCSVLGQCALDCVSRPPEKGGPSYEQWLEEKTGILKSLENRSKIIVETLNKMEGFSCNPVQGAMYAFPRISLPPKALEAAKKENRPADVFYAFKLLEETGICIVAGSGFRQKPGTYHFRTTILPQEPLLREMCEIFQKFHAKFTKEYS